MKITELSSAQLRQLADIKDKIAALEVELQSIFGGSDLPDLPNLGNHHEEHKVETRFTLTPPESEKVPLPKRRTMPPEFRAKMAKIMKRRWKNAKIAGTNHI